MQIPRFWANASDQAKASNGQDLQLKCWGWSNESLADARIKAVEVLERLATRVRQGLWNVDRYPYGVRALREEIIQEVQGSSQPATITRNSYGALILNTERVMFIDIDVPEPKKGFFGKAKQSDEPYDKLRKQLGELRASFRIYRTAGGFRVLATDSLFEPGSSESERLMQAVGADPAFVQLCRAQRSFRARLTPKPWRCNVPNPPNSFPREETGAEQEFHRCLSIYDSACMNLATCQKLEEVGSGGIHDEVQPLLNLHDDATRCTSGDPLA